MTRDFWDTRRVGRENKREGSVSVTQDPDIVLGGEGRKVGGGRCGIVQVLVVFGCSPKWHKLVGVKRFVVARDRSIERLTRIMLDLLSCCWVDTTEC